MAQILKLVPLNEQARAALAEQVEREAKEEAERTKSANAATIKCLKEWMEMAERGEIVSVAVAAIDQEGEALYEIGPYASVHEAAMLGAIGTVDALMKAQVVAHAEEAYEDEVS